jgi:hypothetical protein
MEMKNKIETNEKEEKNHLNVKEPKAENIQTIKTLAACASEKTILIVEPENCGKDEIESNKICERKAMELKEKIVKLGFNVDHASSWEIAKKKIDELGPKIGLAIVNVEFGSVIRTHAGSAVIKWIKEKVPNAKILAQAWEECELIEGREYGADFTVNPSQLEEFLEHAVGFLDEVKENRRNEMEKIERWKLKMKRDEMIREIERFKLEEEVMEIIKQRQKSI